MCAIVLFTWGVPLLLYMRFAIKFFNLPTELFLGFNKTPWRFHVNILRCLIKISNIFFAMLRFNDDGISAKTPTNGQMHIS